MSSTLYSTAENPAGSLAQRLHFQRLEGARGPIGAMAGIAIAAALLIAVGNAFGVLISNTDSAAPAGVYRVVAHEIRARRFWSPPACRLRSPRKVSPAAICAPARAPATRSRLARSWALFPATSSRSNPDGSP